MGLGQKLDLGNNGICGTLELLPQLFEDIIHILPLLSLQRNTCCPLKRHTQPNMCIWDSNQSLENNISTESNSNNQAEYFYS